MKTAIKRLARKVLPPSVIRLLKGGTRAHVSGGPSSTETDPAPAANTAEVDLVESRLWAGYAQASLADLSRIANDPAAGITARSGAELATGRWRMAHDGFEAALEHLSEAAFGGGGLEFEAISLWADCLCRLVRGREALSRISPLLDRRQADVSTSVRVGSARSLIETDMGRGSGWVLGALNRLYIAAGLVPVSRRDMSRSVDVDNLTSIAPPHEPADSEHLISVIVPAGESVLSIKDAIDSVSAQSWGNLEIILVATGGADETADATRSIRAEETRVKLVSGKPDEGMFAAINAGVAVANGDFITVHRIDEWSHPQKLELQASVLSSSPSLQAIGTHRLSVGPGLIHRSPTGRPRVPLVEKSLPSLLFRRAVFDRIGHWDEIEGPAFLEFSARLETSFGKEALEWIEPELPLSLLRVGDDSRSNGPLSEHVLSFASLYRDAFEWWHASDTFDQSLPYRSDRGTRPFALPTTASQERNGDANAALNVDLLVVGDFSDSNSLSLLTAIRDRTRRDVGLIHIPAYQTSRLALHPRVHQAAMEGWIRLVTLNSQVRSQMVVLAPSVLESPRLDLLPLVTTKNAYVWSSGSPSKRLKDTSIQAEDWKDWLGVEIQSVEELDRLAGSPRQ